MRGPWFLIPFSIMWFAFALFWEYSVLTSDRGYPIFFVLWGAMFVAIGLYFVGGRFLVAARDADRTRYVLTDRRVIIESGAFTPRRTILLLDNLPPPHLSLTQRFGDITFGTPSPYQDWLPPGWPGIGTQAPAFKSIQDAEAVLNRIAQAQAEVEVRRRSA